MVGEHEANADATIRREILDAIDRLLGTNPSIGVVAFDGTGARRLYDCYFARCPDLTCLALPSTSPAPGWHIDSLKYTSRLGRGLRGGRCGLALFIN